MLKKLFRLFAGGRARPEIVFTCRGINSELVINLTAENMFSHRGVIYVFPDCVTRSGFRRWQLRVERSTAFLAVVHNNILKDRGLLK
ncbi:hypothetical protein OVA10_25405 [Lelliottia sp. SL45]|uniref:hypothetical protein n=1 Tax=Lelliottia TaxID=1330545 RepID=UPI00192A7E8C|nr:MULTISPECIES: hypothetical protein [Lelliottia]ELN2578457.1 hypothetical protein [Enterobacter kobei]MBL5920613.1 hypothetical protein [Lelliottia amnigena]MCY1696643.1 hypothetical protein [Lelliottia sp. SL45]MCY1701337.1 hypothetical protein [Lelliottia sp. SL45]